MPSRDDARLANHLGQQIASELLLLIRSSEKDFYSSDARLVAANLQEMQQLASAQFKRKHPTVADEILKAFAWACAPSCP